MDKYKECERLQTWRLVFHRLILLLTSLVIIQPSWAWGPQGHRIVAKVAERHLSADVKKALAQFLAGDPLDELANWPDWIRGKPEYKKFSTWHYATHTKKSKQEFASQEEKGSLLRRIVELRKALRAPSERFHGFSQREKIAWLVHLVGDIHQPLHVGRPGDRGGNDVLVTWFGKKKKLHAVWDGAIIKRAKRTDQEWLDILEKKATSSQWSYGGDVKDWARESVTLHEVVYAGLDTTKALVRAPNFVFVSTSEKEEKEQTEAKRNVKKRGSKESVKAELSEAYFAEALPAVEKRLYQAGRRLAKELTQIFRK